MNIATVAGTFFPSPGGAQVQTHNLCNKLYDLGVNIDCYIFEKSNIHNNNYKIFVLNRIVLSIVFLFYYYLNINLSFILKIYLSKIIKIKKYDLWHFNFLNFKSLILMDCLKDLKQKIVVTFQGIDLQLDSSINYGYRLDKKYDNYLKKVINKSDHFFYISKTIKEDLIKLKIPQNKMTYFPNSVELNKFQNEKLKININKHLCFITVARFSEKKKGYDLLPEIAEGLIKKKIKFKWTIIGTKTSQLMKNEIIKNNKEFFEIIENIDNFDEKFFPNSKLIKKYLEADLYINLSRIESFGITFIEALASKIPIVTFNTKGVNEIVTDNYNGFVIPEISNSLMVNKIHELCSDFSKVLSIKENTLKSVQIYDLNIISEKILRTYESISLNNID